MKHPLLLVPLLAALVSSYFYGRSHTPPSRVETKTVYVDRVQVVEKVVTKDVVRTVTKPDGTKIVTETTKHTEVKSKEVDKTVTVGSTSPALSRYSLGIGIRLDPFNPLKRQYEAELGKRLWNSPIWLTGSVSTNKTVLLGLRLEF